MVKIFSRMYNNPELNNNPNNKSVDAHDGDMYCFTPQTIQTTAEIELIANVSKHFIDPRHDKINNNPDTIYIDWKDAMNIFLEWPNRSEKYM